VTTTIVSHIYFNIFGSQTDPVLLLILLFLFFLLGQHSSKNLHHFKWDLDEIGRIVLQVHMQRLMSWIFTRCHIFKIWTCKASRFKFKSAIPIRFESDGPIRKFSNANCSSQLNDSNHNDTQEIYRLTSSVSDHTPVLFNVFDDWYEETVVLHITFACTTAVHRLNRRNTNRDRRTVMEQYCPNPLHTFPRNLPVDGEVDNLLLTC